MSEFNAILQSGFQEASVRETFARQIQAKIKEINGAEHLLPVHPSQELSSSHKYPLIHCYLDRHDTEMRYR